MSKSTLLFTPEEARKIIFDSKIAKALDFTEMPRTLIEEVDNMAYSPEHLEKVHLTPESIDEGAMDAIIENTVRKDPKEGFYLSIFHPRLFSVMTSYLFHKGELSLILGMIENGCDVPPDVLKEVDDSYFILFFQNTCVAEDKNSLLFDAFVQERDCTITLSHAFIHTPNFPCKDEMRKNRFYSRRQRLPLR